MENEILEQIETKFSEIEDLYNKLSDERKEHISMFHNDSHSLPFCIRWGVQAIAEYLITEDEEEERTDEEIEEDNREDLPKSF